MDVNSLNESKLSFSSFIMIKVELNAPTTIRIHLNSSTPLENILYKIIKT